MTKNKSSFQFTTKEINSIRSTEEIHGILKDRFANYNDLLAKISYEKELQNLQIELLKLQNWILKNKKRVVIIFEGRDAAGKGGTIRRFARFLNPRSMRLVALSKPTDIEKGQWYFRRHVKEMPNPGEIIFFDRSWYNRAVVEPVMGFCTNDEYEIFIRQVPEFEHMLFEDGVEIIKFWFSISKEEQDTRFKLRTTNLLKQWKLSPVDIKAQDKWDDFTKYKEAMFSKTHTSFAPWIIVKANDKKKARLESIRHVLSNFNYDGKEDAKTTIYPDPNIVQRFNRSLLQLD